MPTDFKRAKEDLLFFSKRFQGILDIVPHLENISNINNYIQEKEKLLKNLTDKEHATLKLVEDLQEKIPTLEKEAFVLISNAKEEVTSWQDTYLEWEKTARVALEIELENRRIEWSEECKDLVKKINTKKKDLSNLVSSTQEAVNKYENIVEIINALKGRV